MRIVKVMKVAALLATLSGGVLSSGCDEVAKSDNTPPSTTDTLEIGTIGAIPTNNPMATFPLQVFNNTSKEMNLTSVSINLASGAKVTDPAQLAEYLDDSACKTIAAHGSCSLALKNTKLVNDKGVGISGNYEISLATSNGMPHTAEQIVSYQYFNIDPKATSVVYSNISSANKVSLRSANNRSGVTMPLYFPRETSVSFSAVSNLGASFVGCGNAVNNVYHISAGSSCSIISSFSGGKNFTYPVSLTQVSTGQDSNPQAANNQVVFVSSIINNIYAQAYLVAGASSSTVLANGTNVNLFFLNNGNAPATSLSASVTYNGQTQNLASTMVFGSGANQVTLTTSTGNNCSTVAIGQVCVITLSANSAIAGVLSTSVSYNGGLNTDTAMYSVYFYPVIPVPILSVTGGNFLNTVVGTSVTQTFTVTNISTTNTTFAALQNVNMVGQSGAPTQSFTISNNTCTTPLAQNASCSYQVTFTPTAATASASGVQFQQPTTYTYNGQTVGYQAVNSPTYSAVANTTDILFSVNTLQEVTPLNTTVQKVVTIQNNSASTVSNIQFFMNGVTPSSTGVSIGTNTCTGSLAVSATCNVTFVWAPTGSTQVVESGSIVIDYNLNGTPSLGDILPVNFVGTTSGINIVAESFVAVDTYDSALLSGAGTQASPYSFYNTGNGVTFSLTYQNIGTSTASNVVVDTSMIPYGFTLVSPIGSNPACGVSTASGSGTTLLPNGMCDVTFTALSSGITTGATAISVLNFTIPNVTNVDTTTGQNYIADMLTLGGSSTLYVTSKPLISLNMVKSGSMIVTNGSGGYATQESLVFSSLLNNITGAPQVNITTSAAAVGGIWTTNGSWNGPETLTFNVSPAGAYGQSTTVYLNYNGAGGTSITYSAALSAGNVIPAYYSSIGLAPPIVAQYYTTSGNNIVTYNAVTSGIYSSIINSYTLPFTAAQLNVMESASNPVLLANSPATYGTGNDGVWVASINPNGSLGSFAKSAIGNSGSISYLTTDQNAYAFMLESTTSSVYTMCKVSGNGLTNCVNSAAVSGGGINTSAALSSIAVDSHDNVFVTQGTNLYACGVVNYLSQTCINVALPSYITSTSTSGATVTGVMVAATNAYGNESTGTLAVNQVLTESLTFPTTPATTNVAFATYDAGSTGQAVSSFTQNTSYGAGLQMASPQFVAFGFPGVHQSFANSMYYVLNGSLINKGASSYSYYSYFFGNPIINLSGSPTPAYSFNTNYFFPLTNNTSVPLAGAWFSFTQ